MPALANIGPRGVRARALQGGVALAAAAVLFAVQAARGAGLAWTIPGTFLLWLAGIGIFQARAKTWLGLAARGTRDDDAGEVPVLEAAERDALRRQARRVHVRAVALAAVGTAAVITLRIALSGGR